jgi:hypothetical protein
MASEQSRSASRPATSCAKRLHTLTHIVDRLGLGVRAQALAVGCGAQLAQRVLRGLRLPGDGRRCLGGYGQNRARAQGRNRGAIGEGIEGLAEFHAMPVLELP